MENVPKIVQARLQRTTREAAEAHPDADLLTAFAEQSLSESEREQVMEHVARCGECREVVALALPASESVFVPSGVRVNRGAWLSWPVLRWGVVAAGIVLVASVGTLQYKQRTLQNAGLFSGRVRQQGKVSTALPSSRSSTQAQARAIIPQAREKTRQAPTRRDFSSQSAVAADQASPSPNAIFPSPQPMNRAGVPGAGIGSGSAGGIAGGVFRPSGVSGAGLAGKDHSAPGENGALALAPESKEALTASSPSPATQASVAAPTQQVTVSGASQVVEVQAESGRIATQDQTGGQRAQNQTVVPPQTQPLKNLDVVRAKDSVPPQTESSVVFAPTVSTPQTSLQKALRSSPRWGISSSGGLQRSYDAGTTWEDVNVSPAESRDEYQAKQIWKKERAKPVVVFRAVAAFGPEVWAGGSGAMLYHSLDSGNHWARVVPSEANASLIGDVVGVEFSDAQHGRIASSAGEVWTTGDDGQSWHKQ
ncbi:MAG: YCF48-related protein [Candidatus Sulfotelmatobacter sp.]